MANGRVQTQGVGSAPKLQAVVNAGGQYTVRAEQAGVNDLQKLAGALSLINPILKDYAAIQDIDAEMYEDDLKRLSDVEAKKLSQTEATLSQSEATLDREVRKGNIPFFGSPLNWKRKKRALGKRMHDVFFNGLMAKEGRLYNPIEGDDGKNTAEIVEEEMRRFVEDNPGLHGQFEKEGFQEALNPTITRLTAQFDGEKARIAKGEILLENTSDIYRRAKDAMLDNAQYDIDMAGALGDWKELNAFNAGEQLKVIENVAKQLAKVDERKAYNFLKWADQNLKVGNTRFNKMEDHYDRIQDIIEKEVEVQGRLEDSERAERLEATESEFILAVNAIQNTGEAEYDGQMYNDVNVLLKGFQETVAGDEDPIYAAQAQKNAESAVKGDVDVDEYAKSKVRQKSRLVGNVFNIVKQTAEGSTIETPELRKDPRFLSLQLESVRKTHAAVNDKLQEMVRTGQTQNPDAAGTELDNFIRELIDKERPILEDRIFKLNETAGKEEKEKTDSVLLKQGTSTEAETENIAFPEDEEDIITKLRHNLNVRKNKGASKAEVEKALEYEQKYGGRGMDLFAHITKPNSKRIGAFSDWKDDYTQDERKKAKEDYFFIARLLGEFRRLDTLKNKVTRHGLRFEYGDDVNSNNTVFTTPEQIENAVKATQSDPTKVPQDVRKIAKLIGEGSDDKILRFIRNQDNIHKLLNR